MAARELGQTLRVGIGPLGRRERELLLSLIGQKGESISRGRPSDVRPMDGWGLHLATFGTCGAQTSAGGKRLDGSVLRLAPNLFVSLPEF